MMQTQLYMLEEKEANKTLKLNKHVQGCHAHPQPQHPEPKGWHELTVSSAGLPSGVLPRVWDPLLSESLAFFLFVFFFSFFSYPCQKTQWFILTLEEKKLGVFELRGGVWGEKYASLIGHLTFWLYSILPLYRTSLLWACFTAHSWEHAKNGQWHMILFEKRSLDTRASSSKVGVSL